MKPAPAVRWWMPIAATAGAALLRGLGATWRIDRRGLEAVDARLAAGGRCIFALWHSRILPLAYTHRGRGIVMLVSRHHDGELIARIIERMGYAAARGSSTRGGEEGALEMLRYAGQGRLLGITPDGPRGPAGRVKPGLVYLASRTGLPVVPAAAAAASSWSFASWDRLRLPRPLARVVVAYGEPLCLPPQLDAAAAEAWRVRIETSLEAVTREVTQRAGEDS